MDLVNEESFLSENSTSSQYRILLFSYIFCSSTLDAPLQLILKMELKNLLLDSETAVYIQTTNMKTYLSAMSILATNLFFQRD